MKIDVSRLTIFALSEISVTVTQGAECSSITVRYGIVFVEVIFCGTFRTVIWKIRFFRWVLTISAEYHAGIHQDEGT